MTAIPGFGAIAVLPSQKSPTRAVLARLGSAAHFSCHGKGLHQMRHGGKILVDQLEAQGASAAFTVPGESFLAALDGLHDSNRIKTVICRQEGGAAMMAEAWGKLTGEPGVCFVTRGPGAANAMTGTHVEKEYSNAMIQSRELPSR